VKAKINGMANGEKKMSAISINENRKKYQNINGEKQWRSVISKKAK